MRQLALPHLSRILACGLVLVLLPTTDATIFAQSSDRDVKSRRAKAIAIAKSYAEHEWRGSQANRFHGVDPNGVRVDTPDGKQKSFEGWKPDGSKNVGIPYKWGGFTRVEDFDRAITAGEYAGQLPVGLRASRHAVGVDCSGFVSRCWELPMKQSTRSLGKLCYRLDGFDDLKRGDIVNTNDGHVMLFAGFANASRSKIRVYEATLPKVLSSVHQVRNLKKARYEPLRYKPLDRRWIHVRAKEPTFEAADDAKREWIESESVADAAGTEDQTPLPLADAGVGDWCAYRIRESEPGAATVTIRRLIAKVTGDRIHVQSATRIDEEKMETLAELDPKGSLVETLIAFRDFREAPKTFTPGETSIEYGEYRIGDRVFPAQRVRSTLEGVLTMRGKRLPFRLAIDVIRSDDVPVEGVLRGEYVVTLTIDGRSSLQSSVFELISYRD